MLKEFFLHGIESTVKIKYPEVPHTPEDYLKNEPKLKIFKKYLHKYFKLKINGQIPLLREHIPENSTILWLYTGKRNFGDAIMDISGRALLKNKSIKIDLLTLPHLKTVFEEDDIFRKVYSYPDMPPQDNYDYAILSEFNHPTIRLKSRYYKKLPFACLFGFFLGPDRNQTLFSFSGINSCFKLGFSPKQISTIAKPYITSSKSKFLEATKEIPKECFITISVGGIDPWRTYQHWPEFLGLLNASEIQKIPRTIVLLGSGNGLEIQKKILSEKFLNLKIVTFVDKLSILESREFISKASLFIGCDGGLMHVAHSTNTRSISLFRVNELPHLRLTQECHSLPIHSTDTVNSISPTLIFELLENIYSKNH